MSLTIPLNADDENFEFTCELDAQTYGFQLRWNAEADAWFISLFSAEGEAIYLSQRLVADWPLFGRCTDARMFPGLLMGMDTTGAGADPGRYDIGSRFLLLYTPFDDL